MKEIIKIWLEYTNALVEQERAGGTHYDDSDFTFDNFIKWVMRNYNY